MKTVDIEEPTSFLDHVFLGFTQRECEPNEINVMFESHISAAAPENYQDGKSHVQKNSAWSCDMERHARKCMERYCELANKTEQLHKVSSPCVDDHQIKKDTLVNTSKLSQVCSQVVLTCMYLARIGRPDILWSVNKLARSVTNWTQSCDKRLARSISCIHHISDYRHCCHVGNTAHHCRLGLFHDSDFTEDLQDSTSTSAYSEAKHLYQSVGSAKSKLQCLTARQNLKLCR